MLLKIIIEYIYLKNNIIINKRLKYIKSKYWNTHMKKWTKYSIINDKWQYLIKYNDDEIYWNLIYKYWKNICFVICTIL